MRGRVRAAALGGAGEPPASTHAVLSPPPPRQAKKEKGPGDSRMWLVVAAHDTKVDLVALATKLGYGKIVLRFGGELADRGEGALPCTPLRPAGCCLCSRRRRVAPRESWRRARQRVAVLPRQRHRAAGAALVQSRAGSGRLRERLQRPWCPVSLAGQCRPRRAHPQARGCPALLPPADKRGQHRCVEGCTCRGRGKTANRPPLWRPPPPHFLQRSHPRIS